MTTTDPDARHDAGRGTAPPEAAEPTEATRADGAAEDTDAAEPAPATDTAEPTEPAPATDTSEPALAADTAEPAAPTQAPDTGEPAEPALVTSTAEPTEPAAQVTDTAEPAPTTAEEAEPAQVTEPVETPAPGQATGTAEPTDALTPLSQQDRSDREDQPSRSGQRWLADRYRLDEVLGRGATGTVWGAYDEVLRRRVAVKEVPPPPGMPAPEADMLRERTLREARAIAVLSHPNVVTLYDVVRHGGEPFVVMELLPARTLAALISEHGPLDVTGAAIVGSAVASALQSAHQAGITHRDVKPGNVLIGEDGRIKLTDFGISRNVAESTLTVTGMTLGSPAFIAPEVASGGQVTPAADLWGLGATLFAAVQGRPPYDAGDPLATVTAVVHGEVPWPTNAGPLTPVISGLMVKDPSRRLPLQQVRQMLHPLIPPDGQVLRHDSDTVVLSAATASPPPLADPSSLATDRARDRVTDTAVPLAAQPGPLPFTVTPRPRRRSKLASVALALACLVLFTAGAGGGFALARTVAGKPLVPALGARGGGPPVATSAPAGQAPPLTSRTEQINGSDPGTSFTIQVPAGWAEYRAQLHPSHPGLAAVFVSPDGSHAIHVERLADFYPKSTIRDFRNNLDAELDEAFANHMVLGFTANGPLRQGATDPPHELTYRTVSNVRGGTELGRSTFVQLIPTARDLWVLGVTVPTEQERAARLEVFEQVRATFAPAGT